MDNRVQDYLDDRLQSFADFDSLNNLLETVHTSQRLLQEQLEQSRREHGGHKQALDQQVSSLKSQAQVYHKAQNDIDKRLLQVTNSTDSDEAVTKFQTSMNKLQSLDIISGYVELLLEVDKLSNECRNALQRGDETALPPFQQLQHLSTSLQPLQDAAEGAAPHLTDHIAQRVYTLKEEINVRYASELEKTLKALQWPKATRAIPLALENEWARNISQLLGLQRRDLEAREIDIAQTGSLEDPPVLFALAVLVRPLEQRFAYHFSGNKPTNRLDKPEYFLNHITELVDGYGDFLENALQPILISYFRGSDLVFVPAYIDATTAFITALLPMVKQKLSNVASQSADQPSVLSHLVHEVIHFDTTMQESFAYAPSSPSQLWRGLSHYLLDTCGYFQRWLDAEREFALTRYQAIIDKPDAGELDYDSVPYGATKPAKAAIRVNDLLETVTEQYRALASFSQKLRFLIDIQIAIFDKFHTRLHSSLEAYMTMTSSVARTMHGITKEEQRELQGVKGLDRLCRVFGSAEYLEGAMRDWSDDVFFLELWDELQHRSNNRSRVSQDLGTLQEIKAKTSSAVGSGSDGEHRGALFDETADAYKRLRVRSENVLVETLTWNVREALKPYCKVNAWASLSTTTAGGSLTTELEPTLRLLSEYLDFLSRAVGRVPLRRMTRLLCHSIQTTIWEQVLLRHTFSTAGALQLSTDIDALCTAIDRYAGPGQAQAGLRKLCDGIALLRLPVKGEIKRSADGVDDDGAAWDEEMKDDIADEHENEDEDEDVMGLFEAERMIFKDNEAAREALERLELEAITEADARHVLERRVEVSI